MSCILRKILMNLTKSVTYIISILEIVLKLALSFMGQCLGFYKKILEKCLEDINLKKLRKNVSVFKVLI